MALVALALLAFAAGVSARCGTDDVMALEHQHVERLHRELQATASLREGQVLARPRYIAREPTAPSLGALRADSQNNTARSGRRRLQQGTTGPIRIKPLFQDLASSTLTTSEQAVITDYAVPRAIRRLASMLSVEQSQQALQLQRHCPSVWVADPTRCAEAPVLPSCGFFSTDRVASVPVSIVGSATYYPNGPNGASSTIPAGGPGLSRTDFVVFVLAGDGASQGCSGTTQAYAASCQRDSTGRPIAGTIVMCKGFISDAGSALAAISGTSSETVVGSERRATFEFLMREVEDITVHEILHALGFSGDSWPLFVSSSGAALTPRQSNDPETPSTSRQVTCFGQQVTLYYASSNTVAYPVERGSLSCDPATLTDLSSCVHRVVLASSRAAARATSGCEDLSGTELENQPTTQCALAASHLEQRVHADDMMSPFATHVRTLSAATLAVMEDSGWYTANYYSADDVRPGLDFGVHAGCDFARDAKCLVAGDPPTVGATQRRSTQGGASQGPIKPANHYCTQSNAGICTADRRAVGLCDINQYTGNLPNRFRYFTADATRGGQLEPDFCPLPAAYSNRICIDPANNWDSRNPSNGKSTVREVFGNVYGPGSACLESESLIRNGWTSSNPPTAGCFRIECIDAAAGTLRVSVDSDSSSGASTSPTSELTSTTCTSEGELVGFSGYSGTVRCPDPTPFCGTSGPVIPTNTGRVGFSDGFVQVLWPETGDSAVDVATVGFRLARGLYGAGESAASVLGQVTVRVTLRAAQVSELALSGLEDAVAGTVGTDLGLGLSASSSSLVTWQAGEAGHKQVAASLSVGAWPTTVGSGDDPAPRVFMATLTVTNGTANAVDPASDTAVVVLSTKAPAAFLPSQNPSSGAASTLSVLAAALVIVAAVRLHV